MWPWLGAMGKSPSRRWSPDRDAPSHPPVCLLHPLLPPGAGLPC